jgi:hypothetical protein
MKLRPPSRLLSSGRFVLAPFAVAVLGFAAPAPATAQGSPSIGPVIHSAGPVFEVPDPDFETPTDLEYRIAYEVVDAAASPEQLNPRLVTVARFLNMHARAGVPVERLHVALVVHGPAGRAVLDDVGYRERRDRLLPGVEVALSAMTALLVLQERGFHVNPF